MSQPYPRLNIDGVCLSQSALGGDNAIVQPCRTVDAARICACVGEALCVDRECHWLELVQPLGRSVGVEMSWHHRGESIRFG
jgi:hypothetical protein